MPGSDDRGGPIVGVSWNEYDSWKKAPGQFQFGAEPPWQSFSNTLKTAKTSTDRLVLYARANPSVQRLVSGYEEWECNLRKEARARLSNVKRLQDQFANGLPAEDWDLLRRVSNNPLGYGLMKRSSSENTLSHSAGLRYPSDGASSWQGPTGVGFSADSLFTSRGSGNFPRTPSVPDFTLQARSINNEAAKNLEALASALVDKSKQALQTAQQGLQQTAYNCQQNLQTLSLLIQQNSPPLGASNTQLLAQVVSQGPNQPNNVNLFLPWSVLPNYLRVRELAASAELGSYSEDDPPFWPVYELFHSETKMREFKSLRSPGRQVAIVTTAALPWLTGTSVNPLLRATYLSQDTSRKVTLVVPWLSKKDQARLFPNNISFDTPEQQEQYIREWAKRRTGYDCSFKITFYPGRYATEKCSILPVGDITACIPDHEADVAVLEEPEHLNWYHHGKRWTDKFAHVVGVMHTNYLDYARREERGNIKEFLLKHINAWVCRVHCHKVIKLSNAVQPLPREETMFVHGVSPAFLKVGERKAEEAMSGNPAWPKGVYFIGKVLWAKGYTELLERLNEHMHRTGHNVAVDIYGSGEDLPNVKEQAQSMHLQLDFKGPKDHADASMQDYKVFINPSLSDVVATTTAEALAMGKWVICAHHPSNEFFSKFHNCLVYHNPDEFSACLERAMASDPKPLSPAELRQLTWEAATERFLDVAEITKPPNPVETMVDNVLHGLHNALCGVEAIRVLGGAGAGTKETPLRLQDYEPPEYGGGFFDDPSRGRKKEPAK